MIAQITTQNSDAPKAGNSEPCPIIKPPKYVMTGYKTHHQNERV